MAEYPFPSIAQTESKKDKAYYRAWVDAIVNTNFNSAWTTNYNKLALLYNFFKVGTGSDLTGYLQTAPDGSAMPGIWMSSNNVHTRLQSLIGELDERGYQIKAKALNAEAVARKYEEREKLRIERRLAEVLDEAEEISGLPDPTRPDFVPQTDQELDEYMDLTWKDKHVQILETALKWIANRSNWDDERKQLFIDKLIGNMCVVRHEIVRGVPQSPRVDLMKFILDPHATGDLKKDSTFYGEVDYQPLAAVAERYGLTLDEMKEAQKEYESYLGMGMESRAQDSCFGSMPGQTLKWFKTEDGIPRCLVIKAAWRDIKILQHKDEENEKGTFFQEVSDKDIKKKDNIVRNKIECWRRGTIIGGKFLREYGECPNQPRSLDSLEVTKPPYEVWTDSNSVSILERLVTPQVLKDIALYQLQIQMARAIGKVLVFDEAMMPEGQSKEQVVARMKADGIVWVNSKEYQLTNGNLNLFKEFDLSLSQSIAQSVMIIDYLDKQIDSISGITPERQGMVQGASQAVGVTQAALSQSNLVTAPLFRGFDRFCSRVLTHQAGLVKMAWTDPKKFAPIIGDAGVDFLKNNIDISLDEFDVVVQSLPPLIKDRQMLEQILFAAMQTGELLPADVLNILLEPDLTVAVRKYTRKVTMRQMQASQQEERMAQMEQQMKQMQMQQQTQTQQGNNQTMLQIQQMKDAAGLKKTLIGSRTKLQGQKLDLLSR
jgi:hypothetical protein